MASSGPRDGGAGGGGGGGGDSLWKKILVPVAIALLIGTSSPWWIDRIFPPGPTPGQTAGPGPQVTNPPIQPTAVGPVDTGSGPGPATAPPDGGLTGCTLTVARPFAEIRAEPNFDKTRLGDVPEGTYEATESTLSDWAGTDFRWFLITADGRTGWIVDNGFMFQEKSAACP